MVLTLLVTVVAAPGVAWLMGRRGVLDVPNERSSHAVPVPRGGGLAGLAGLGLMSALVATAGHQEVLPPLGVAAALGFVGLLDDHAVLPPLPRLAAQVVAGGAVGAWAGGPAAAVVGLFLMPAVVNMVNFMDGIDGISGVHAALWGMTTLVVGRSDGSGTLIVLGGVTAGIGLGFLPWNIPKARLFLGDTGSYLLGGLIGSGMLVALVLCVLGDLSVGHVAAMGGAVLLYFVDTADALVRRARRGVKLTQAHREHVYQRLANEGGYRHVTVSLAMLAGEAAAVAVLWVSWPLGLIVAAAVTLLYLLSPRLLRVEP
ncbi:MAG: hypothetical protein ABI746_09960 [Dermatophilaceae bacterium]